MGKYIKKFATHAEYQSYISGSGAFLPNVSTCDDQPTHVHYNPEPLYRTISGDPYCNGYDKYVDVDSQVSYDNGRTWETTATTATLVERDSADCGYVNDKLVVTYDVRSTTEDTALFDRSYGSSIVGIEIDGVELQTVQNTYRFSTTGEHVVKYTFNNPAEIGSLCFKPESVNLYITKYEIPETITYIGYNSLCSSKDKYDVVVYSTTPPSTSNYIFGPGNVDKIYVPEESVDEYKNTEHWSYYSDKIVAM